MKFLYTFIAILLSVAMITACTEDTKNIAAEEYVIKTRTGECYHSENCWTIAESVGIESVTVEEAENDYGLRPCGYCQQ